MGTAGPVAPFIAAPVRIAVWEGVRGAQDVVPRTVDSKKAVVLDGAGGGNRTHTPYGTGF